MTTNFSDNPGPCIEPDEHTLDHEAEDADWLYEPVYPDDAEPVPGLVARLCTWLRSKLFTR